MRLLRDPGRARRLVRRRDLSRTALAAAFCVAAAAYSQAASAQSSGPLAERLADLAIEETMGPPLVASLRPVFQMQMREVAAANGVVFTEDMRDAISSATEREVAALFSRQRAEIAGLYAEALTEDELRLAVALFESPEGRAMMSKMTGISDRISDRMSAGVQALGPRIAERLAIELAPLIREAPLVRPGNE